MKKQPNPYFLGIASFLLTVLALAPEASFALAA